MIIAMKKYVKYTVGTLCLALVSCDYLDPRMMTQIDEKDVYNNMTYITQSYTNAFSYLPSGFLSVGNSLLACATDEAESVYPDQSIQSYNTGSWDMYSNPDGRWETNYNGIRQCCDVRDGIATYDFGDMEHARPQEYAARRATLERYLNELRFLKAFYHYELVKRYGGVPIVDKKLDVNDPDDLHLLQHAKRNTFEECIDFIVGECDAVAPLLPTAYEGAELGHITRGTALALKSRVLLMAASDLYNQPGNTNPYIGYISGNRSDRWAAAAAAAQEVIDLNLYDLHTSYSELFLLPASNTTCKEAIWGRRTSPTRNMELYNYPIGYNGGQTSTCPSQDLVDAYEMKDGTLFDWNNAAHAAAPYANRDPRLKFSILTNGDTWCGREVEIWEGGQDGLPRQYASKTGYYLKKFLHDNQDLVGSSASTTRVWHFFRYGEILLNYAEAANRCGGPDYTVPGAIYPLTAVDALNKIRARAGVGMPDVNTTLAARGLSLDQTNLETLILNERRVELAFEDFRWFDARRLMKAPAALGGPIHGVRVVKGTHTPYVYTPFVVEQRVFNSASMYFYPIPQSEISKSNGEMVQNPGWQSL